MQHLSCQGLHGVTLAIAMRVNNSPRKSSSIKMAMDSVN